MKKYDGMFIFTSAREDAVDKLIEKASAEITRLGGQVLSSQSLGKKTFAHLMHKHDSGLYIKIRFELDPAQVKPLQARYLLLEDFFRVQILVVNERREALLAKQAEEIKVREAKRAAEAAEAAKASAEAAAPAAEADAPAAEAPEAAPQA